VYLQHGAASYVDIWEQSTVWIPHLTARALEILLLTYDIVITKYEKFSRQIISRTHSYT